MFYLGYRHEEEEEEEEEDYWGPNIGTKLPEL